MKCLVPGCQRRPTLVTLPLVGRTVALCRLHGPARMVATMRELIAHG
jgi:hypothetical protein